LKQAAAQLGAAAQRARVAALTPPADGAFTFAVIGDAEPGRFPWERVYAPGPDGFWRLLSRAGALSPAFVLQLGDLVSKGTLDNYRALYKRMAGVTAPPFFNCIGNHDRSRPNGDADKFLYEGMHGSLDYYFDYAGWRFVALDTSDRALRDDQMRWLEQVVTRDGRTVIFTHVPPAFLKKHFYSPPKPDFRAEDYDELPVEAKNTVLHDFLTAYFDDNSDAFGRLLQERRVPRVYLGHIHAFGVARRGPTLFVLSGGGGSPLYPLPPGEPKRKMTHFLEVRVSGDSVSETVHELDGSTYAMPLPPSSF
jgi:predicted phosphodiesterase